MTPNSMDWDYLLEISRLYDRIVKSGSQIPVIDLALKLEFTAKFFCEKSAWLEICLEINPNGGSFEGNPN